MCLHPQHLGSRVFFQSGKFILVRSHSRPAKQPGQGPWPLFCTSRSPVVLEENNGDMLLLFNLNQPRLNYSLKHYEYHTSNILCRQELCPEKRMLFYPNLPKIIGSDFLETRLRSIHGENGSASASHVFGHTHFCWDAVLDGLRYHCCTFNVYQMKFVCLCNIRLF